MEGFALHTSRKGRFAFGCADSGATRAGLVFFVEGFALHSSRKGRFNVGCADSGATRAGLVFFVEGFALHSSRVVLAQMKPKPAYLLLSSVALVILTHQAMALIDKTDHACRQVAVDELQV